MSLACKQLSVSIAGKRVAEELDLLVSPGEFWGLLGANGVGKTTLLRCLAGLIDPDSGKIALLQQDLSRLSRRAIAQTLGMLQQHTVYVFDASVLQTALTGRHPHLGAWQREGPQDIDRALRAIRAVDLDGFEDRSVTNLSGGEARRLAFATVLVQEPQVFLLDEPTNHLDFRHQVRIMRMIGDEVYNGQRLALAALHDVNLAACYCSHVLMLFGNGEWRAGPALELLTEYNLQRLYQCPVNAVDTPDGKRFHPSFTDNPA